MTRTTSTIAIACIVGLASICNAGPIPSWSYWANADMVPSPNPIDFPVGPPLGPYILGNSAPDTIGVLEFDPVTSPVPGQGTRTIRVAGLWEREVVSSPGQDRVDFPAADYSLLLNVRDAASGQVGVVPMSGRMSGFFTSDSSAIENRFDVSGTLAMLKLGDTEYRVSSAAFVVPGPPSDGVANGEIDVTITPLGASVNTPEPATLLLAGIGGAVVAGRRWLRRRHTAV
jgi:PEP-CTERM motif